MAPAITKSKRSGGISSKQAGTDSLHRISKVSRKSAFKIQGDTTVTLRVGKEKTPFKIHRAILCNASLVFYAAFNSLFAESRKRSMRLPEDDPATFERVAQWLYRKTFEISTFKSGWKDENDQAYKDLVSLYIFAEKYSLVDLKNDVIDRIFGGWKLKANPLSLSLVESVYAHTPPRSKLRVLFATIFAWGIDLAEYEEEMSHFLQRIPEFSGDLVIQMAKRISGSKPESNAYSTKLWNNKCDGKLTTSPGT